jgi:hypothetical protein
LIVKVISLAGLSTAGIQARELATGRDEVNVMKVCRLLHPPGETISLTMLPRWDDQFEERLIPIISDVLADLSGVVQPLEADLTLVCRERSSVFEDRAELPVHSRWSIREHDVPAHVSFRVKTAEGLQASLAPQLTPDIISNWLRGALAQDAPSPEYVVTFNALECWHTRSRLYDSEQTGEFQLFEGIETLKIPIERRADGTWVSAPVYGLSMYPAIAFEIANYDGLLNTKIHVSWSRWVKRETREHEALQQALRAIVSRGWKPELVPRDFDLGTIAAIT